MSDAAEAVGGLIAIVIIVLVSMIWSPIACHAKWDDAGYRDVKWRPISGCKVQTDDGRWLPTDRVREIQ